jgi:hypothetical protein
LQICCDGSEEPSDDHAYDPVNEPSDESSVDDPFNEPSADEPSVDEPSDNAAAVNEHSVDEPSVDAAAVNETSADEPSAVKEDSKKRVATWSAGMSTEGVVCIPYNKKLKVATRVSMPAAMAMKILRIVSLRYEIDLVELLDLFTVLDVMKCIKKKEKGRCHLPAALGSFYCGFCIKHKHDVLPYNDVIEKMVAEGLAFGP